MWEEELNENEMLGNWRLLILKLNASSLLASQEQLQPIW